MSVRNYLVEGGSGTGETAVCEELSRRGFHTVHGDRELASQGDPQTGAPVAGVAGIAIHDHHLWRVEAVRELVADESEPVTFFCDGARNRDAFVQLFDAVFVLEVDLATLRHRLDARPSDEWGGAGRMEERELIEHLHLTGEGIPRDPIRIDATAPLPEVVDEILRHCR